MKCAAERKSQVMQWLMIAGCILLSLLAIPAKALDQNTITIGIISPKDDSSLALAGESHEESIRLAFEHLIVWQRVGGQRHAHGFAERLDGGRT